MSTNKNRRDAIKVIVGLAGTAAWADGLNDADYKKLASAPKTADDHRALANRYRSKPELPDRGTHTIDRSVVLPRIAGVEDQLVDRPDFDLKGRSGGHALSIAVPDFSRQQSISIASKTFRA